MLPHTLPPEPLVVDPDLYIGPCKRITVPLALDSKLVLTANKQRHHHERADVVTELHKSAGWAYRDARSPKTQRAHIVVVCYLATKRTRDIMNWYPTAKAHLDAMVKLGLLPDDNDEHCLGPHLYFGGLDPKRPRFEYLVWPLDPAGRMPYRSAS